MDLALFDFDGTITSLPTYTPFIRLAVRPMRRLVGGTILAPMILGYRVGLVSQPAIRRVLSRAVFWREDPVRVRALGERYAREVLPGVVRPIAFERIAWHQARGDRVVVVSASLDAYLEPWCRDLGVEVICTRLEQHNGRLTGRYVGGDCCHAEKVRRVRERIALDAYDTIYAYGDTDEDRELLELADRRYFRWQEIAGGSKAAVLG